VDAFSVTRRRAGDAVVVSPRGEIDLATVDELGAALAQAAQESGHVVLDLRAVAFMDSAGVRLVLTTSRALDERGGALTVVQGPHEVRRVFELVGLTERLTIVDAPPDA